MAGREKFTDDELSMLTEEERAGLLDEELVDPEEELDAPGASVETAEEVEARKPDEDPVGADEDAAAEAKKPETAAEAGEKTAEAATEAAAADTGVAESAAPAQQAIPRYEVPADAKDRLKAFDDRLDELATKADDGEITFAEMRQQQREIERDRDELREQVLKQSLARDFGEANWFSRDVPGFLGDHPEYSAGSMRHTLLDSTVRKLQSEADNPFDPSLLSRAHALIEKELGPAQGAKPTPAPTPQPGQPGRELPPSLAHVPASDISEATDGGKYAHLDRLADSDPMAYEDALARMSDADRDAYLASA